MFEMGLGVKDWIVTCVSLPQQGTMDICLK